MGSIFLRGNYIELGMHTWGSFGAEDYVSEQDGFHPWENQTLDENENNIGQLGFIVDPDGWDTGNPPTTSGDFFIPGTPEEVWGVTWSFGTGETASFMNAGLVDGGYGAAKSAETKSVARGYPLQQAVLPSTGYPQDISNGNDRRAVWRGVANNVNAGQELTITQTVHFDINDKFFVLNVVMTNTGTVTINDLKYLRSVDPDQESGAPVSLTSVTNNYVVYQPPRNQLSAFPPDNTDRALVIGAGSTHGVPLGLGTIDGRARVAYGGFTNRDPAAVLNLGIDIDGNSFSDTARIESPNNDDEAIALAFDLGSITPGQSITIDYAYILDASDLEVALGELAKVTILQPVGTVSGSAALFQASTNNTASATLSVEFFVNGTAVGIDNTPDRSGVYEVAFDSTVFDNGSVPLEVVAYFADESSSRKSSSVQVDNSGPPIAFVSPTPSENSTVSNSITVQVDSLDTNNPPVSVSFFREVGATSLSLGTVTSAPYQISVSLSDLAVDTTVVIKAVANNARNGNTTITRVVQTASAEVVSVATPSVPLSQGDVTIYGAISPSTPQGVNSLIAALTGNDPTVTRAFTFDHDTNAYVEMPTQPVGGLLKTSGIFIATRVPLNYSLSGTPTDLPTTLTIPSNGWTFIGVPLMKDSSGNSQLSAPWSSLSFSASGISLTGASLANAMGTPGGVDTTAYPWYWTGTAYEQRDTLEVGKAYWFKNNLLSENITITVPDNASSGLRVLSGRPQNKVTDGTQANLAFRDQGRPPAPPSLTKAQKSNGNSCGVGAGVASLLMLFLFLSLRLRSNRP